MLNIDKTDAWIRLQQHAAADLSLSHLFEQDLDRGKAFCLKACDIYFDYSKNHITAEILSSLLALAEQQQVKPAMQDLFSDGTTSSAHVNVRSSDKQLYLDSIQQLEHIVEKINNRQWLGVTNQPICDIVHVGVGGSALGPLMVNYAFQNNHHHTIHFVSAMDGGHLNDVISCLNSETTLFIIASKSFTSIDTLANAESALLWMQVSLNKPKDQVLAHHFIGISAQPNKMSQWGLVPENRLCIKESVRGRYSVWSAMGLPVELHLGMDGFKQFLAGAEAMDKHFGDADLKDNMPVIMALLSVWNNNFMGCRSKVILPYDSRLLHLPAYLQQLIMESNGKSYAVDGKNKITCRSTTAIWGELGFFAQHSFFQFLHQGTEKITCDFIAIKQPSACDDANMQDSLIKQHKLTLANCFSQSRALMLGSRAIGLDTLGCKHNEGNKASNTLLLNELTPYSLGSLLSLYEHKTVVEAVIYNINPFDQWGVELGKDISRGIYSDMLVGKQSDQVDSSTAGLLDYVG